MTTATLAAPAAPTSPAAPQAGTPAAPAAPGGGPDRPAPAKLIGPRADAAKMLRAHLEKGLELRDVAIQYADDLEQARARKLEWTQQGIELLGRLFDNGSVSDYCNDWVGKIFPEYAEFGNFVDQFYEEMDHRLGRVRSVLKRIELPADAPSTATAVNASNGEAMKSDHPATANHPAAAAPAHAQAPAPAHAHAHAPASASRRLLLFAPEASPAAEPVSQFLRLLDLNPVTVQVGGPDRSMSDAIEQHADAAFAIVLQGGRPSADPTDPAAARLAGFQLGYCVGRLGTRRVCTVHTVSEPGGDAASVGLPSVALDPHGGWQVQLARHLKRAGLAVDLNRIC